jgi:hypothetical protein
MAADGFSYLRGFGRHSRIPECCIDFFITTWLDVPDEERADYVNALDAGGYEYIPCPTCLDAGVKVAMHHCDMDIECCRQWWPRERWPVKYRGRVVSPQLLLPFDPPLSRFPRSSLH